MINLSTPSKSFLLVIILIIIATYGAFELSDYFKVDRLPNPSPSGATPQAPPISTRDWLYYIDPVYPLVFKYPPKWTVETITTEPDYYVVAITPDKKKSEMRVYINDQDYFALRGLPSKLKRVGNQDGLGYGETLASAKVGNYYYTFDGGMDTSLVPEFQSLLTTIEFR